jgi:hypothetical protein
LAQVIDSLLVIKRFIVISIAQIWAMIKHAEFNQSRL